MLHAKGSSHSKGTTRTSHLKYTIQVSSLLHLKLSFYKRVSVLVGSHSSFTFKLFMQNNFGDLSIVAEGHVMTFNNCSYISSLKVARSNHDFKDFKSLDFKYCKRFYVL